MAEAAPTKVDGSEPPPAESLQFDQAEYQQPAEPLKCAGCQQPITDAYYALNDTLFCDTCQQTMKASLVGGSKVRRLLRALLFGTGAAIAGFALYYGVLVLTGFEIGLISILVGLMVGAAVRKGAEYRGGWAYQAIAILLTYSAIAASYSVLAIPQMMADLKDRVEAEDAAAAEKDAKPNDAAAKNEQPNEVAEAVAAEANQAEAAQDAELPPPSPGELLFALLMVGGILFALPVIVGFEQPIGLLIIGFALYEAWKMNLRVPLQFTGPHPVGPHPNDPSHATAGVAANG